MKQSIQFKKCPCTGKTLPKIVQPAVMAVLAKQPLHGYKILQRLRSLKMFENESPDPAGVYRLLHAMSRKGLVTARWNVAKEGPAQRQFRLTPRGQSCLKLWAQSLDQYVRNISNLLAVLPKPGKGRYVRSP
jgi:DNA-binding PadR family transcriptional regulator